MKIAQALLRRGFPLAAKQAAFHPATLRASSLLRCNIPSIASAPPRFFSSQALVDILAREEKEEKDTGNLQMPSDLADLKSSLEKTWKIVEDGATTNLFMKDKKVQISFHCQDTVEEDMFDEEENEEESEPLNSVQFCVTVSKAGKTLVVNCLSEYGEARIESVMTSASTPDAVHANQGNLPEKSQYQGPEFSELAEDLQEAFAVYLEGECGVNSDVASFVAMYSDYREQSQYAQFLKDVQSIIA